MHPLSLFACFSCRHVENKSSYSMHVSGLITVQGLQRYGDVKFNGTVWLAKGWGPFMGTAYSLLFNYSTFFSPLVCPQGQLDDVERAINNAVNAFKALTRDARCLAAGGAAEMEVARQLQVRSKCCVDDVADDDPAPYMACR